MHKSRRLVVGLLCQFLLASCNSNSGTSLKTYKVTRGDFLVTVTETGELSAVNSRSITAPTIPWHLGGLKISKLVADGKEVAKNEILVEFDKTEVQKNLEDANAALEIAQAEVRKAVATQKSEIDELESDLLKSELHYRVTQLELEKAGYEAEIDRQEKELDLERAENTLEQTRRSIENRKKLHHEELNKLQLRVKQQRTKVEQADETLAKLTLVAPTPGIAILKKNRTSGNKIQVDEDVWRGHSLIGLPDLSLLQATAEVNEVDISKIKIGQKVKIRLDAFPDTSFAGHVSNIAVLARDKERGSKVKVFDATVLLAEKDSTFMPGMTVSCEIIVDSISDTLFVPLDALFKVDGKTVVYLRDGSDFKYQPVVTGAENDNFVVIVEGVKPGDEVVLTDPFSKQVELLTDSQ